MGGEYTDRRVWGEYTEEGEAITEGGGVRGGSEYTGGGTVYIEEGNECIGGRTLRFVNGGEDGPGR